MGYTASMKPEKFLTLAEFNALLKAAKDERERCILLLLAGAGLQEVKRKDRKEKIDIEYILICSGTALLFGALIAEYL